MYFKIIKRVIIVYLVISFFFINNTSAQVIQLNSIKDYGFEQVNQILVDKLYVQLLPENSALTNWDDNRLGLTVNCLIDIKNDSNIKYDGAISFPLDSNKYISKVNAVYEITKGLLSIPFEFQDGMVSWKPTEPILPDEIYSFKIEYYIESGENNNGTSKFNYIFSTDYIIRDVVVDVFMPFESSEHMLEPLPKEHSHINNNIIVYSYFLEEVSLNKPIDLTFKYKKYNSVNIGANEFYLNDFNKVNFNIIGIVIFTLLLSIIGISVISISSKSKRHLIIGNDDWGDIEKTNYKQNTQKKNIRKLLIEGKINEETYKALLYDEQKYKKLN